MKDFARHNLRVIVDAIEKYVNDTLRVDPSAPATAAPAKAVPTPAAAEGKNSSSSAAVAGVGGGASVNVTRRRALVNALRIRLGHVTWMDRATAAKIARINRRLAFPFLSVDINIGSNLATQVGPSIQASERVSGGSK